MGVAAWMLFVRERSKSGERVTDPLADQLIAIGRACDGEPIGDVARFLALGAVFPRDLAASPAFRAATTRAYGRIDGADPTTALAD
jgi:fructuronate reductase